MNTLTEIAADGSELVKLDDRPPQAICHFDNMLTLCCEICTTDEEAEHLLPHGKNDANAHKAKM